MRRVVNPTRSRSPRSRGLLLALTFAACAAAALLGGVLLENDVAQGSADPAQLTALGMAHQERVRTTGDPAFLAKSEEALKRAAALAPRSAETQSALASLALARHQFEIALRHARRAQKLAPTQTFNNALAGDALIELGHYHEAFTEFDRLAKRRPGLAAYARVAYARELLGRPAAALEAHRLAVEATGPRPELKATALAQLGELHIDNGRLPEAERAFRSALRISPGFGAALEGLAHVAGSRGRYDTAIRLAKQAGGSGTETLGDLYLLTGKPLLAERQYAKGHDFARREAQHGVRTDLEIAEFEADHGVRLGHALVLARRAHRVRPSIEADSILGWALTRNGRCREALPYAERALRLGTRNAKLLFRRGMVDRCLDKASAGGWFARAVAVSPHFSLLWSPVARRYAAAYHS